MKRAERLVLPAFVFLLSFLVLCWLASIKWFWTDEAYSLWALEYRISPWQYLLGNSSEGTSAPLFFLLAKGLFSLEGVWTRFGDQAVIFYRFVAIIPTSLFLAFVAKDAFAAAGRTWASAVFALALVVALFSTSAVIGYGWQARPYGLWMLFSYLFWREGYLVPLDRRRFFVSSTLLALTTPFGMFEILSRWVLGAFDVFTGASRGTASWREWAGRYLLPLSLGFMLAAYYSLKVLPLNFQWPGLSGFISLISAHAKYWLYIPILLSALFLWKKRENKNLLAHIFFFLSAQVTMVGLVVVAFFLHRGEGFELSNRYFIFLLPQSMTFFCFIISHTMASLSPRDLRFAVIATSLVLVVLGAQKLKAHFQWIDRRPPSASIAELKNEFIQRLSKDSCVCHDKNYPRLEIGQWGYAIFAIREWNLSRASCDGYVRPLAFAAPEEGGSGVGKVIIVTTTARSNKLLSDCEF